MGESICDDCPARVTTYNWQELCVVGEDMGFEVIDNTVVATREECGKRPVLEVLMEAKDVKGFYIVEECGEDAYGYVAVEFMVKRGGDAE